MQEPPNINPAKQVIQESESAYLYTPDTLEPMLTAVILDDEERGSRLLLQKLKGFETSLQVLAAFNQPAIALAEISALKPDVLFLDVEMPGMNGFQFLESLGTFDFEVIFTTAYDTYTLDALRLSAVDYLMKPVDEDDLDAAITRLHKRVQEKRHFKNKHTDHEKTPTSKRLALPTSEGVYLVEKSTITHVEAMSNYSTFHTVNHKKIIVSKTLREYEDLLCDNQFIRVSRSAIVNLDFVVKYRKGEGGTLELADGKEIEVSAGKKNTLLEKLFS
jgi:two-component system LytT family response regulator